LCFAAGWGVTKIDRQRKLERTSVMIIAVALSVFTGWLWYQGSSVALGDSSMRILWQLLQGGFAGIVLLAGCWLLFEKRAGIVLLHGGIGLLMISELLVGTSAVESQIPIKEGGGSNFTQDIRSTELAVTDPADPSGPTTVAIPQSYLDEGARFLKHRIWPRWVIELLPVRFRPQIGCTGSEVIVRSADLPFDLKVVRYVQNAKIRMKNLDQDNPATVGIGREIAVDEVAPSTGTGSQETDQSAIYVELLEKGSDTGKSLGTYLLTMHQSAWQEIRDRSNLSSEEMRKIGPFIARSSEPVVVKVGDKSYQLALRHKRTYKPYTLFLKDVRHDNYPGTETPRNYSSDLHLVDPSRQVDRDVKVWMNNPLRFAGETFYQQSVKSDEATGAEMTVLQVVSNTGWMIPYVSCMIVAVGMLFQFSLTLGRFLKRREAGELIAMAGLLMLSPVALAPVAVVAGAALGKSRSKLAGARQQPATTPVPHATALPASQTGALARWFPLAVVVVCAMIVGRQMSVPTPTVDGFDLYSAGKLPLIDGGRTKPFDTLARNTLQVISNRETFVGLMPTSTLARQWTDIEKKLKTRWPVIANQNLTSYGQSPAKLNKLVALIVKESGADKQVVANYVYSLTSEKQPPVRWLLDVISGRSVSFYHRVFRIENLEVLAMFGLEAREGYLYSLADLQPQTEKFGAEVELVRAKIDAGGTEGLTVYERKLMEFNRRLQSFLAVNEAFAHQDFPAKIPDEELEILRSNRDKIKDVLKGKLEQMFRKGNPPLVVPVSGDPLLAKTVGDVEWLPYGIAYTSNYLFSTILKDLTADPAVAGWTEILSAYEENKPAEFNVAVNKYRNLVSGMEIPGVSARRIGVEVYFNQFSPFFQAWILYIFAFVLSVLAWLGWNRPLSRAAFWLTVATFALHTVALGLRIYISGRPPVTNLYSSAVFIGWGCVALGLVLEIVFKLGVGNVIASIAGFATLFISFKLSGDGDTLAVMQAVLDTQFWLATHVTCITMGYATTFVTGLLGLFYVLCGVFTPRLNTELQKNVSRMIYGTLCFAIFFSFVGTVLGGLWADDSWGRFWGWDPKENGALIIVLWNALILHARWGAMVHERGMAVLAVVGNIVTSWSWFGVNELGIGLHSYGFTEGVLLALGLFVLSQLAVVGIGMLPRVMWRSFANPLELVEEG
jgi:ABC-type transport system involved in cytochrome c biogenesis permease subunit